MAITISKQHRWLANDIRKLKKAAKSIGSVIRKLPEENSVECSLSDVEDTIYSLGEELKNVLFDDSGKYDRILAEDDFANDQTRAWLKIEDYYLNPNRFTDEEERQRTKEALFALVKELGPVVTEYPTWHPLNEATSMSRRDDSPYHWPGFDHALFFANGFITCPYSHAGEFAGTVAASSQHELATLTAEVLDFELYAKGISPVVVRCDWLVALEPDGTVPVRYVAPLILENELPCRHGACFSETWDNMRDYFLGAPQVRGRSSPFVNRKSAKKIRKVWEAINATELYGPLRKKEFYPPSREVEPDAEEFKTTVGIVPPMSPPLEGQLPSWAIPSEQ